MKSRKEYYAFISYKREDEPWAKWLQYKLEHYRFPTNLNGRTNLPKNIYPTFRDVTDLTPGLLAERINNALCKSEWLIVVCSPRSAKSPWVCKEAQTFIDLGLSDHIIPFVIEGNPFSNDINTECYPQALLDLKGSKELLGANINEMGRDAAAIKIVARMFNLRFNKLWRRHEKEQRRKRLMCIGGAILFAILGLCISIYFVKQNKTIEKQNENLQKLISDLREANNTYSFLNSEQKQYSLVGKLRGNGCQDMSLMNFDYHPYESIVAFSDDWGFWLHYLNSGIEIQLPTGNVTEPVNGIQTLCFSNDGTELMAIGWSGTFVWNVESHKLIHHHDMLDESVIKPEELKQKYSYYYNDDETADSLCNKYQIKYNNGLATIIDKKSGNKICSTRLDADKNSLCNILFNPKYKEILIYTDKRAALYDDDAKNFVLFFKGYRQDIGFSKNGDYLRVDNNIYERTVKIDTIRNLKYEIHSIDEFPNPYHEDNHRYNKASHASLEVCERNIKYRRGDFVKNIEVIKNYTIGNMQEYLSDALFAGPNRIVAIAEQGKFRIYNTNTWTLIGTLDNYVWVNDWDVRMGHEKELCHADSYIACTKYINKKLYVLSSGGIIRIYNIDKCRLETVIELPVNSKKGSPFLLPIEKSCFAEDGKKICYTFKGDSSFYLCKLPTQ